MQKQTRTADEKAEEVTFGSERIADKDPAPKEENLAETWDFPKYDEVKYWEKDTPNGRVLELYLCIGGQPSQHVPGITNVAQANAFQDGFNAFQAGFDRWKAANP